MPTTNLGKFTYGEAPGPLLVTMKDKDGNAYDLTGHSVVAEFWVKGQTPADTPTQFAGSLNDASNGIVSIPWGTTDPSPFEVATTRALAPYTVELEVWSGNGTVRYASEKFRFAVLKAVADATPAV